MWFSFWRLRDPFSLEELRYLTDQLEKVSLVSDSNKDIVIEHLRSIAELVTYGDQHDPAFFEIFMEKQVMTDLVRILRISKIPSVVVQLLQTMSIMIQNLRSDHAVYYIFSNEHINDLITYDFDFGNEELLSYYISFLRAISGKLNKSTISLLVKSQNDEIISFPLYNKGIKFAFHEENMIRTAVRALTLNVFHVGDESVNRHVTSGPLADYFSSLIIYFRKQCFILDELVSAAGNTEHVDQNSIQAAADEIEDTLYYLSDAISSGIPNLEGMLTENIMRLLIVPLLLPSLRHDSSVEKLSAAISLYLLCCILQIAKMRDLASCIAAVLFVPLEAFAPFSNLGCCSSEQDVIREGEEVISISSKAKMQRSSVCIQNSSSCCPDLKMLSQLDEADQYLTLRDVLLSYVTSGNDAEVLGSLSLLATLLQTKELHESVLDALGILPERKQQKKLLLQALVGEELGEEQLFSSKSAVSKEHVCNDFVALLQKMKDQYGFSFLLMDPVINSEQHRRQVVEALISLFCRSGISAETLWDGGWLLRQLLPCNGGIIMDHHFQLLQDSYRRRLGDILKEIRGSWCDLLLPVLVDEWKKCKKVFEAVTPKKDLRRVLFMSRALVIEGKSSFAAAMRMHETVKVFVLHHQLCIFASGKSIPDQPAVVPWVDLSPYDHRKMVFLDVSVPKPGTEVNLADALPCRIAFERGKERHFCLLAVTSGFSGWVLLAEELPFRHQHGVVRLAAPLAGSDPRIDDKHPKWLHLCVRPSVLQFLDLKTRQMASLVDGRWTLAFKDEETCKLAECLILEAMQVESNEVHKRLKPLLEVDFCATCS